MLGKDLYKCQSSVELSNERLKSLVFFYEPLIGSDCLHTYLYLSLGNNTNSFKELNDLLTKLGLNVDVFEKQCDKLNEFRLLKTFNKENEYIFKLLAPLTMKEFVKDDLFVRNFILKTSGTVYQDLLSNISFDDNLNEYQDVSKKFAYENLINWSEKDETYLYKNNSVKEYNFNTLFNVNTFLKRVSTNLFPLRFRSEENLKLIATLADLYNISYDKMMDFIPKITKIDSDKFDSEYLKYLCMHTNSEYSKVSDDEYNVPCLTYLMSLQDGKEVSEYDKKILLKLSNDYHLNPSVINVLIRHCLNTCDNRLIEKYIYGVASDLHRNNVINSSQALERLNSHLDNNSKKEVLPTYNTSNNPNFDEERFKDIMNQRNK